MANKLNKNQKGITITSLVVVIVLILIISGTLIYNAITGANLRRLNRMYNDIELLSDKVSNYYAKYGDIPVKYDSDGNVIDISSIITSVIPSDSRDANDDNIYYILELVNLKGISLNYGKDYDKITSLTQVTKDSDLYIINKQSHKIYYLKGVGFEGTTYYTKEIDTEKVI